MSAAIPDRVEVPLSLLQRVLTALEGAGQIKLVAGMCAEDARAVARAEAAAIGLQVYVQHQIDEVTA